jgi:hypothetical protein
MANIYSTDFRTDARARAAQVCIMEIALCRPKKLLDADIERPHQLALVATGLNSKIVAINPL